MKRQSSWTTERNQGWRGKSLVQITWNRTIFILRLLMQLCRWGHRWDMIEFPLWRTTSAFSMEAKEGTYWKWGVGIHSIGSTDGHLWEHEDVIWSQSSRRYHGTEWGNMSNGRLSGSGKRKGFYNRKYFQASDQERATLIYMDKVS